MRHVYFCLVKERRLDTSIKNYVNGILNEGPLDLYKTMVYPFNG